MYFILEIILISREVNLIKDRVDIFFSVLLRYGFKLDFLCENVCCYVMVECLVLFLLGVVILFCFWNGWLGFVVILGDLLLGIEILIVGMFLDRVFNVVFFNVLDFVCMLFFCGELRVGNFFGELIFDIFFLCLKFIWVYWLFLGVGILIVGLVFFDELVVKMFFFVFWLWL